MKSWSGWTFFYSSELVGNSIKVARSHVPNRTWDFFCLHGTYNKFMTSGVYAILNVVTNQVYVGCSSSIEQRWERHMHMLEDRQHPNYLLQVAFNTAQDVFTCIILEVTFPENKYKREQVWFDRMIRHHELYNLDLTQPQDLVGNN
jgi:hypothetical protein